MNITDITPEMIEAQTKHIKHPALRKRMQNIINEALQAIAEVGKSKKGAPLDIIILVDGDERGKMHLGHTSHVTMTGMIIDFLAKHVTTVEDRTMLVGAMVSYMAEEGLIDVDIPDHLLPKDGIVN